MLLMLLIGSVPVIAILVSAAFVLPPGMPVLLRQVLLCVIGVGGIMIAERRLFGNGWSRIVAALGFVASRPRAVVAAIVVSVAVVLASMYLSFAFRPWLQSERIK